MSNVFTISATVEDDYDFPNAYNKLSTAELAIADEIRALSEENEQPVPRTFKDEYDRKTIVTCSNGWSFVITSWQI